MICVHTSVSGTFSLRPLSTVKHLISWQATKPNTGQHLVGSGRDSQLFSYSLFTDHYFVETLSSYEQHKHKFNINAT